VESRAADDWRAQTRIALDRDSAHDSRHKPMALRMVKSTNQAFGGMRAYCEARRMNGEWEVGARVRVDLLKPLNCS
jgi:hypothetical protein